MIQKHFEDIIRKKFGYDFSPTQQIAVEHFIRFFFAREEEGIFLLKGYAGTGKTSLVAAIVNALVSLEYKVVLLAPTPWGRSSPPEDPWFHYNILHFSTWFLDPFQCVLICTRSRVFQGLSQASSFCP